MQTNENKLAYNREWRKKNPEKQLEYNQVYKLKYPQKVKEKMKKYYENVRKEVLANDVNFPKINRERVKKYYKNKRSKVLDHYGNKCACCGETNPKFLTIDHINNDGSKHRKLINSSRLCPWLVKNNYPDNFQILCWNCNHGKQLNNGICPHKEEEGHIKIVTNDT